MIQIRRSVLANTPPTVLAEGQLAVNLTDKTLWIGGPNSTIVDLGGSTDIPQRGVVGTGTAYTIDFDNGTDFEIETEGDTTITLPAAKAGKTYTLLVKYGGVHTLTFAGGTLIKYEGGTAPTPTSVAGKWDKYSFSCDRAATATIVVDAGRNL